MTILVPGVRWEHCGGAGSVPVSRALQQLLVHWKKRGIVVKLAVKSGFPAYKI